MVDATYVQDHAGIHRIASGTVAAGAACDRQSEPTGKIETQADVPEDVAVRNELRKIFVCADENAPGLLVMIIARDYNRAIDALLQPPGRFRGQVDPHRWTP
jgi:hypothetical protein